MSNSPNNQFYKCDLDLDTMTLILKLDLDMVMLYVHTKNEVSRHSKVKPEWTDGKTHRQTDTQMGRHTYAQTVRNSTFRHMRAVKIQW